MYSQRHDNVCKHHVNPPSNGSAEAADGDRLAQEVEASAIEAAEKEAAAIRKKAESDAAALAKTLAAKRAEAATAIVRAVTQI